MEAPTQRKWHLTTGDGIALASVIITIALALQQSQSAKQAAESQKRQNFVQIAVGVLSKGAPRDKEGERELFPEDEQALRKWSVQVLNHNIPETPIPEAAQKALIEGKSTTVRLSGYGDSFSVRYDDWGYSDYNFYDKGSKSDANEKVGSGPTK